MKFDGIRKAKELIFLIALFLFIVVGWIFREDRELINKIGFFAAFFFGCASLYGAYLSYYKNMNIFSFAKRKWKKKTAGTFWGVIYGFLGVFILVIFLCAMFKII